MSPYAAGNLFGQPNRPRGWLEKLKALLRKLFRK